MDSKSPANEPDVNTLERFYPDFQSKDDEVLGGETLELHFERYRFAAKHLKGPRVLDCSCGVGYGTALMAEETGDDVRFVGADVSDEAIAYARERYAHPRIEFIQADGCTLSDEEGFDTIVTLETIEHVPDYRAFVANLVTLLKPDGRIIASVPYTPSVDGNPHHLHDFTRGSFGRLFRRHGFVEGEVLLQVQPFKPVKTVIKREEARSRDIRRDLPAYYLRHPWAVIKRLWSTLRYGFTNRYITAVWTRL